ncbi:hypothetical protein SAMN02910340_02070 [Methanosarcina thermophila]|uniref:Uncharacterized protein n=1 Tax=Methanosarcina thermophila TaxID=2210 RepID=A0A1I7AE17_METTE|nr:hypothetical protein [Methanosarcina thermophila]SFT73128.1 hypothetical protein SAMN02910340_02070 [Methanosarcina thermophila]
MSCPYAPENSKKACPLHRFDSVTCRGLIGHDYCGKFKELEEGVQI